MNRRLLVLICVALMGFQAPHSAGAQDKLGEKDLPRALKGWRQWVLYGQETLQCPGLYNDDTRHHCHWPSHLILNATAQGARFEQHLQVFAKGWVPLPGSNDHWPAEAAVDGLPVPVVPRQGTPQVQVSPGEHRLTGWLPWKQLPDILEIDPAVGLISLTVEGQPVPEPRFDRQGRLWLRPGQGGAEQGEQVQVRIARRIVDDIPMQVIQLVSLAVAGRPREFHLPSLLLADAVPMALESALPARIESDGSLTVQVRPGRWTIDLTTRLPGPVDQLAMPEAATDNEIWCFEARSHLRMVTVSGAPMLDPAQTDLPETWKRLPAYRMVPGSRLHFKEIRRGDPQPAPDRLTLQRSWWLDFDGKGYTIHDEINGSVTRNWQLIMNPPALLGRVVVDGQDRMITHYGDPQRRGIELRQGRLELSADSRISAAGGRLATVGWDHDFNSVSGVLHLPPGWRLLAASGADALEGTWPAQWSLLDLFVALIITIAVYKRKGFRWGAVALLTMLLIYQEFGAPRLVWLNLLAAMALLDHLPAGRLRKAVLLWGVSAGLFLAVTALPFMVQQIRVGIHPQLELGIGARGWTSNFGGVLAPAKMARPAPAKSDAESWSALTSKARYAQGKVASTQAVEMASEPDALIQTGPGLPKWQWRSLAVRFNGPVERHQKIHLWLISPAVNLVLAVLRVVLLLTLVWGIVDIGRLRQWAHRRLVTAGVAALLLMSVPGAARADTDAAAFAIPPAQMLDQLRKRLLARPDCYPACADVLVMELTARPEEIQLALRIHAAALTAVPLPGAANAWLPDQVRLDKQPAAGLRRDSGGTLWSVIPEGVHDLVMTGRTGDADRIQIPLPLSPRHVRTHSQGWVVRGLDGPTPTASSIELIRQVKRNAGRPALLPQVFPPYLHVQRTLHLGLTWQVHTRIQRLTPTGNPVVTTLPLLEGESITSAGIAVNQHQATINMGPQTTFVEMDSTLTIRPRLTLTAPKDVIWNESWILDAGPMWHCQITGIAPVHHQDEQGHWQPTWQPWPGETVTIDITRPPAAQGRLLTIEEATLAWTPGQRMDQTDLSLSIRSSRGGPHLIELPQDASLQLARIDERSLPVRQEGRMVNLPLHPGVQQVVLQWQHRHTGGILLKTPPVSIGDEAVNATVSIHMPSNRWTLFTAGPTLGPAVRFWSYVIVVILLALLAGRLPLTPLSSVQWLLLGLGLTQVSPVVALMVAGWPLALGVRGRINVCRWHWFKADLMQLLLTAWTIAALVGLYLAIEKGLLGTPEMQIAGNGSTSQLLHWTADRISARMPQPWAFSLPRWSYRLLMLAWALWLAVSLLAWLRWGWECLGSGGRWHKIHLKFGWRWKKRAEDPQQADSGSPRD
jgi:hypothetical protein